MKDIQRYVMQCSGILDAFWTILTSRGLFAVAIYRFRTWLLRRCTHICQPVGFLFKAISSVCSFMSVVLAKSQISHKTEIMPGFFISNKGNVIIGARRIGRGCVIHENVTIGPNLLTRGKSTVGDNVWIGANSVIIGGISIGNGSTVREGSVLTKSIPANCIVQGNPARVIKKRFDNSQLLSNPYMNSETAFEPA